VPANARKNDVPGQLRLPAASQRSKGLICTVEVRRSARRSRTVSARLEDKRLIVYVPARMSRAEEAEWVDRMARRFEERARRFRLNASGELERRGQQLNDRYFGGELTWEGLRYVTNQGRRYGSCSIASRTIRLSDRIAEMPAWVRDYVIVHELAHLVVPDHSPAFWRLVNRYPLTERARGYLIAKGLES
jgi:predicted metal-dependent hydrolase